MTGTEEQPNEQDLRVVDYPDHHTIQQYQRGAWRTVKEIRNGSKYCIDQFKAGVWYSVPMVKEEEE